MQKQQILNASKGYEAGGCDLYPVRIKNYECDDPVIMKMEDVRAFSLVLSKDYY